MISQLETIKRLADGVSLLLVEDDATLLYSLQKMFGHFFQKIYTASSVTEAYELYSKHYLQEPMLLITDINLQSQSGILLCSMVKRLCENQRIIAMSAVQESEIFIDAIECGIDRFLLKPIVKEKLFETLRIVLQKIAYDLELQESQKMLQESKEYALELLKEQDEFLKNAIHEIYTPLSIIIMNIDLLRMQGIDNDSIGAIEAGSRIIQNSYEDMTYLMRHSRKPEKSEPIKLFEFIEKRVAYFDSIAKANEIGLVLEASSGSQEAVVEISALKLSRVVDNTISNALKYAKRPSEVKVMVELKSGVPSFWVNNKGPLIEDKEKIFERFYREASVKGGYGLGLSIVLGICKEENISIQLDSTKESGNTFVYTFNTKKIVREVE